MLKDFLHVYNAIKVVITSFKLKAFKYKSIILIDIKLKYLKRYLLKLLQSYKLKTILLYIILYLKYIKYILD